MGSLGRTALVLLAVFVLAGPFVGCEALEEPPSEPTPDDIVEAALAPKPAQTHEVTGQGVICPGSFRTFTRLARKSSKNPGTGYEWHHIVNQNQTNVDRFGNRLHCTDNLIALPEAVHRKVSGHYSEKPKWTKGKRVRDVINQRSWTEQYEYGLEVVRRNGVEP